MGSTHLSLHYHVIFATKDHVAIIAPAWRSRLHAYMGGIARSLEGVPEIIRGVDDHVHLLLGLRAARSLADVVRQIKANSSRWVHEEIALASFAWQEGYGAFTVSASQREMVRAYIANQEEHHRTRSFREEYLEFLKKSGVDYDPKYVF